MRAGLLVMVVAAGVAGASAQDRRLERQVQAPAAGGAGRRVALVVGNDAYPAMPLRNGKNDAQAMAAALSELGFTVDTQTDVKAVDLQRAARGFVGRLAGAEVGFFFYAGHGLQIEGENFLVPVDFDAQDEIEARHRGYKIDELREQMERAGARVNVIALDACRDNPFRFTRSGSRGLGTMQPGRGTLIALATGPGQTASDNAAAGNGLFTTHLLRALRTPGLGVEQVFKQAREAVSEASGQKQRPWLLSDLTGEVYLTAPPAVAANAPAPPAVDTALAAETALWQSAESAGTAAAYDAYLARYPEGTFAPMAKVKAGLVQKPAPPASTPARPPATPAPAPAGKPAATGADDEAARFKALREKLARGLAPAGRGTPVTLPWLGVDVQTLAEGKGVFVQAITPGGPGSVLHAGDVILAVDGKEVAEPVALTTLLGTRAMEAALEDGKELTRLKVLRQGQVSELVVKLHLD